MFLSTLRRLFKQPKPNRPVRRLHLDSCEDRTVPAPLVGTNMTLSNDAIAENTWGGFLFGTLTPTLPGGTGYTSFALVPGTGDTNNANFFIADNQLRTASNFDYEALGGALSVRVKATAANGVTGEDSFALTLTNVNEQPTSVALSNASVPENSAGGTVVGAITVTDPDALDTHTLSLVNSAGGKFQLNGTNLEVAPGAGLDYEGQGIFFVAVQATDVGGLSAMQGFLINLTNVAEGPTITALTNNNILENSANGSYVGTVLATDPQFGAITYSLTDNAGGRFAMSGNNIVVANGTLLDYETPPTSHNIIVQATASGGSTTQAYTINVLNANEAPTDLTLSNNNLVLPATVVGTLSTTDPDVGDTHTYILTNNAGGKFQLVGNSLQITSANLFSFDPQPSYNVTVLVQDQGGASYSETFTIFVTGIPPIGGGNTAPTDIILSNTSVNENAFNGAYVGTLSVVDDSPIPPTYTLTDNAGGIFAVSGNNIVVANGSLLNYEMATTHNITILATDAGGLTYSETIAIAVNNVNEAPTAIALSNNALTLPTTPNFVVGTLTATDPDVGDTHTFFMGENGGGKFTIIGNQVVVTDPNQFKWNPNAAPQIHVYVMDQSGAIYDQWFTINVTGVQP